MEDDNCNWRVWVSSGCEIRAGCFGLRLANVAATLMNLSGQHVLGRYWSHLIQSRSEVMLSQSNVTASKSNRGRREIHGYLLPISANKGKGKVSVHRLLQDSNVRLNPKDKRVCNGELKWQEKSIFKDMVQLSTTSRLQSHGKNLCLIGYSSLRV
ncbi:hypothetical protein L2E82_38994 [Cichorium intybus]|uniref:Uncharacterized protein n=1 Tax=Cichorium intybus TaxID=13427 RepID=A0ACB9AGZ5_CICIN|nr:hypothetical protein L2E82_38994 [Cichorium intybus]